MLLQPRTLEASDLYMLLKPAKSNRPNLKETETNPNVCAYVEHGPVPARLCAGHYTADRAKVWCLLIHAGAFSTGAFHS